MKYEDLKRPDLAHITCGVCGEVFQSPPPPELPAGYHDAIASFQEFMNGMPTTVAEAERVAMVIAEREVHASGFRLDDAAFAAHRAHSEKAHTLDEHLEFAHGNEIPLGCTECGHEEQATAEGHSAMKAHLDKCTGRRTPCPDCGSTKHRSAYTE